MERGKKFLNDAFSIDEVKDVRGNYLVVSLECRVRLITHQLVMLTNLVHPSIISPEERRINNQTKLYYRINSLFPLRYYLEREEMDSSEVLQVLDEIVGLLLASKNYLLYATSFLLHEDYIFINPATREVSLIYLPIELRGAAHENFRELLLRIYFYYSDWPADLTYREEQFFNLQAFREQLKKIKYSVATKEKQGRSTVKVFQLQSNSPQMQENSFKEKEETSLVQTKVMKYSGGNRLVIFILLQFMLMITLAIFFTLVNSEGVSVVTSFCIFLLIVAFDLLILKKLFKK